MGGAMPMGGGMGMPPMGGMQAQAEIPTLEVPADMACLEGPRAATWQKVKKRFRSLFTDEANPFAMASREKIATVIEESVKDVTAVNGFGEQAGGECGFGTLMIRLLTLTTIEDPRAVVQYLQEHESMPSPVLTLLLDIPWVTVAQTGWPIFGILAQICFHKLELLQGVLNNDALDNIENDMIRAYFDEMYGAQQKGDMTQMLTASMMFLQLPSEHGNALSILTAMATQASVEMNVQQRVDRLNTMQRLFRQALTTPAELDLVLSTRWPLWTFMHVVVDVFFDE